MLKKKSVILQKEKKRHVDIDKTNIYIYNFQSILFTF